MISIQNLRKLFPGPDGPVTVLNGISLEIAQGETFGIIGRSGAGKSTLVRCVNMLERPTTGNIRVAAREMTTLNGAALGEARRGIGMIFQHFNLLSSRTAAQNIALPLELIGHPRGEIARRVDEMLALVGLSERRDAYPAQLSGGQKQRVGIARALATKPSVLLCDEATSALDPETTKQILALLKEINRSLGLTIMLITHEMEVVREVADRVAVLDHGEVVESGRVFDVFTDPRHPVSRSFVGEVLNRELPEALASRMHQSPSSAEHLVFRIIFTGPSANQPIVSEMVRRFGLSFNILQGHVDYIQGSPYGTLTVEASGTEQAKQSALDFLRLNNLKVEILGRVPATDRAVA
ncbi:methionine ABC transporter ATP-binding protein [Paramagnetospirillum kuznetsovii]|uniref:Cell division ATP-binding protein FtsE n=1 Tax=Paramagnetospirillum kuznetsovii TaxID=2053833 RepID=A0A364NTZ3_9PROT|nr:methionine ABC transporter ATP-binding protein [Paramagnetospirillum kuznetsovii]RAU20544.1 methionine ABC transporter ATP-binding protein [Paramagnetospirillum kuznetsovii]